MRMPCPVCGGRTYTYGDLLPGQYVPRHGEYDQRERTHRACVLCPWDSATYKSLQTPKIDQTPFRIIKLPTGD